MTDTGVVDRIRVPGWVRRRVEEAWRDTPAVARLFIGLAIIDVVSRTLGILQPRFGLEGDLFAAYLMLVPHDLWILLPAVLLFRRPDAARATRLVFWGAVVAALATAFQRPLENLLEGPSGPSVLSLEVGALASLAFLAAWVLIARGLVSLSPAHPAQGAAGLSNLVVGCGGIAIAVGLGSLVATSATGGDPALGGVLAVVELAAVGRAAAWVYLLWVVIRGLGDARRPAGATTTAAVGAALTGLFDPIASVVGAGLGALGPSLASIDLATTNALGYALTFVSVGAGQAALVVAFALGLAEPPIPYAPPPPRDVEIAVTDEG